MASLVRSRTSLAGDMFSKFGSVKGGTPKFSRVKTDEKATEKDSDQTTEAHHSPKSSMSSSKHSSAENSKELLGGALPSGSYSAVSRNREKERLVGGGGTSKDGIHFPEPAGLQDNLKYELPQTDFSVSDALEKAQTIARAYKDFGSSLTNLGMSLAGDAAGQGRGAMGGDTTTFTDDTTQTTDAEPKGVQAAQDELLRMVTEVGKLHNSLASEFNMSCSSLEAAYEKIDEARKNLNQDIDRDKQDILSASYRREESRRDAEFQILALQSKQAELTRLETDHALSTAKSSSGMSRILYNPKKQLKKIEKAREHEEVQKKETYSACVTHEGNVDHLQDLQRTYHTKTIPTAIETLREKHAEQTKLVLNFFADFAKSQVDLANKLIEASKRLNDSIGKSMLVINQQVVDEPLVRAVPAEPPVITYDLSRTPDQVLNSTPETVEWNESVGLPRYYTRLDSVSGSAPRLDNLIVSPSSRSGKRPLSDGGKAGSDLARSLSPKSPRSPRASHRKDPVRRSQTGVVLSRHKKADSDSLAAHSESESEGSNLSKAATISGASGGPPTRPRSSKKPSGHKKDRPKLAKVFPPASNDRKRSKDDKQKNKDKNKDKNRDKKDKDKDKDKDNSD